MPYITADRKTILSDLVEPVAQELLSPGELNYSITRLMSRYLPDEPHYADIAEVTGVLENVKQEFYRRYAAPYEDRKIAENGDVY